MQIDFLLSQAEDHLKKGLFSEAFLFYRESQKIWDLLPYDIRIREQFYFVAKRAFDKNPKDDKALFVILNCSSSSSEDFLEQVGSGKRNLRPKDSVLGNVGICKVG